MSNDYKRCLRKKRIVAQPHSRDMMDGEIDTAFQDLDSARKSFAEGEFKWATIQAYYSMFHGARALLFKKGYREKSHFCLKAAIQAMYVDEGVLGQAFIDDYDATMLLRETADYRADFSEDGASASIDCAKRFLNEVIRILRK